MTKPALFIIILIIVCLPPLPAAAQEPELDEFVYLPIIMKSDPPPGPGTPTPTRTPIPTRTPTPTPTATPELVILPNHTVYTSTNTLLISGEFQNNGPGPADPSSITVNLFSAGQLIDTIMGYLGLNTLAAGDKSCFSINEFQPPAYTDFQFDSITHFSSGPPTPNLVIFGDSGTYNPTTGSYKVVGFIRNDNPTGVNLAMAVVTLYDAAGNVLECATHYVNSTNLNSGQASSFEANFTTRSDYAGVASYRLQADGYLQQHFSWMNRR